MHTSVRWLVAACVTVTVVTVSGCAGTRVRHLAQVAPDAVGSGPPPRTIAVVIQDDSRGDSAVVVGLGDGLAKRLVARHLAVVDSGQGPDLLLLCHVGHVRPGTTPVRVIVGFGAGKATMWVDVTLVDARVAARTQLVAFETRSTTGSMPGVIPGLLIGPFSTGFEIADKAVGAGLGVAGGLRGGLRQETNQTAARIDHQLQSYFVARGWVSKKQS